jgi:hypothetical protein
VNSGPDQFIKLNKETGWISMIDKLGLRQKMFMSMLAFTIPLAVLAFLMFQAHTVNIDFGARERQGNQFQRPLEKALHAASLHRIYWQSSSRGDADAKSKISDAEKMGDEAFTDLMAKHAEMGEFLDFTPEGLKKRKRDGFHASAMKSAWEDLKKSPADDKHLALIAGLRTMITHMGDTSNLILDPDLDSYYLMDITLLGLPQTQDRIQDIMVNVEGILRKTEITMADRVQVAVFAALLKDSDIVRITGDAQTALNEDSNFNGVSESLQSKLPSAVSKYEQSAEKLRTLLLQVSNPAAAAVPVADLLKVGHEALDASFGLSNVGADELEWLLQKRVNGLSKERAVSSWGSFIIALIACAFSMQISRSLSRTITKIVVHLTETGTHVEDSSGQLSGASQELSSLTSEAAASLEESVASIEELSSMVAQTAQNSKKVTELSSEAENSTAVGEERIKNLIQCMTKLTAGSKQIEDIITVIDDIAFQTNLLALNAAVEAARAGEQGKGFAVVADSVRSLAQKSAEAAKEISTLIQSNVSMIQEGATLAGHSDSALQAIVSSVQKVSALNKEISQACDEQSAGLGQITTALNTIDSTTQKNAASSEEIAAASSVLLNESQSMRNHTQMLETLVVGIRNGDLKSA